MDFPMSMGAGHRSKRLTTSSADAGFREPKASNDSDVRVVYFRIGLEDYAILSIPSAFLSALDGLTASERDVVGRLLRGQSNAQIARYRRCSPRTVANQVAAIFRKTGVGSRAELAALLDAGTRQRALRN
jgi:DNA-binding CsgD family transcriptional regulator